MKYILSSDRRITWSVDEGRLHEQGSQGNKVILSAADTQLLLDLLKACEPEISSAAEQEKQQQQPHIQASVDIDPKLRYSG